MAIRLETLAGELIVAMSGRLVPAIAATYELHGPGGLLQLAIPEVVDDIRIEGASWASFTRRDVPLRVTVFVAAVTDRGWW